MKEYKKLAGILLILFAIPVLLLAFGSLGNLVLVAMESGIAAELFFKPDVFFFLASLLLSRYLINLSNQMLISDY